MLFCKITEQKKGHWEFCCNNSYVRPHPKHGRCPPCHPMSPHTAILRDLDDVLKIVPRSQQSEEGGQVRTLSCQNALSQLHKNKIHNTAAPHHYPSSAQMMWPYVTKWCYPKTCSMLQWGQNHPSNKQCSIFGKQWAGKEEKLPVVVKALQKQRWLRD